MSSRARIAAQQLAQAGANHDHDSDDDLRGTVSATEPHHQATVRRVNLAASPSTTTTAKATKKPSSSRLLRRRGPLADELTTGKYAAVPRGAAGDGDDNDTDENDPDFGGDVSKVDDIFDMLDMPSDDEDFHGAENEDDIAEQLESLKRRKGPRKARRIEDDDMSPFFADDNKQESASLAMTQSDSHILQQVIELRKQQAAERNIMMMGDGGAGGNVQQQQQAGGGTIDEDNAADELRHAASQLGRSFTSLLTLRQKLQPAIAAAISLPQHYAMPHFCRSSKSVASARASLRGTVQSALTTMLELSGAPFSFSTDVDGGASSGKSTTEAAYENYLRAQERASRQRIDACLEAVGRRVVLGPSAPKDKSDRTSHVPLLDQIRGVMSGLTRLFHRAQKNRAHSTIFGHPDHFFPAGDRARKLAIAEGDVDAEVFDDIDFARELIQRSRASGNLDDSLLKMPKTESRVAFHRKTKGRSVNYDPRPKLVGFMVPVPYAEEQHREALFRNIFAEA